MFFFLDSFVSAILIGMSGKTRQVKMMQHKRSPVSVNQSTFVNLIPKRLKIDAPLSSKVGAVKTTFTLGMSV